MIEEIGSLELMVNLEEVEVDKRPAEMFRRASTTLKKFVAGISKVSLDWEEVGNKLKEIIKEEEECRRRMLLEAERNA